MKNKTNVTDALNKWLKINCIKGERLLVSQTNKVFVVNKVTPILTYSPNKKVK